MAMALEGIKVIDCSQVAAVPMCARILGDGNRYREIQEINKDVIANVDTLNVGMSLKLPHP